MATIKSPFPQFFDTDGGPLNNGSIYIGTSGQNPETNPITVYWDAALTQPVAQPIRTLNGYIARNGSPAELFTAVEDYSITVRNSRGAILYSALTNSATAYFVHNAPSKDPLAAADEFGIWDSVTLGLAKVTWGVVSRFMQAGTGAVARTNESKLREPGYSIVDFGAVGNDAVADTAAVSAVMQIINAAGGGSMIIPRSPTGLPYLIRWDYATYYDGVSFFNNTNSFFDLDYLNITSYGAEFKIEDGAQHGKVAGVSKDEAWVFCFRAVDNLTITGALSLDGNKANAVLGTGDGVCNGIALYGCSKFDIGPIDCVNFATDGWYLGYSAVRNGDNVDGIIRCPIGKSSRRQGMSLVSGKRITIINPKFHLTGDQLIGTAPMAGIDFEPDFSAAVEYITIINPDIFDNGGCGLIADSNLTATKNITVIGGRVHSYPTGVSSYAMWMKIPTFTAIGTDFLGGIIHFYGTLRDCTQTHNENHVGNYAVETNANDQPFLLDNCDITVSGGRRLVFAGGSTTNDKNRKVLHNCDLTVDGDALAAGTYVSIHRGDAIMDKCRFHHAGAAPASPYYIERDDYSDIIRDCVSDSANILFDSITGSQHSIDRTGYYGQISRSFSGLLTIAAGAVTVTGNYHRVDTEAAGATDDLDTINGGYWGHRLILTAANSTRTVVIKHNTGNILLDASTDFSMDYAGDTIELIYTYDNKWCELSRSNNGI